MYIDKYSKGRCQKFKDGHSSQMEMLQARLLTLDDNNVHWQVFEREMSKIQRWSFLSNGDASGSTSHIR
ncbi:hypothetical protein OROGR_026702 [Orobanche gracilis]